MWHRKHSIRFVLPSAIKQQKHIQRMYARTLTQTGVNPNAGNAFSNKIIINLKLH